MRYANLFLFSQERRDYTSLMQLCSFTANIITHTHTHTHQKKESRETVVRTGQKLTDMSILTIRLQMYAKPIVDFSNV